MAAERQKMNRRAKVILLTAVLVLLTLLIVRQVLVISGSLHQVHFSKGGEHTPAALHRWMSIEEIAKKYNVPAKDIFTDLHITPAKGDEKLSLRALKKKYKIPQEVMRAELEGLIKKADLAGTKNE